MKKLFAILLVCLVASCTAFAQCKKLTMRVTANSTVVTDGRIELKDQKRLIWIVGDCAPLNAGYAYEFGPLYLVAPNGEKTALKAKEVNNGPVFHYSISKQFLVQYPQGFDLELEAIKRYNPDHSSEILPYKPEDLRLKVVPVAN